MTLALEQISDLLLRGAGIGLLAQLSLRLLQPPHSTNRWLCLGLVLGIAGYLLTSGGFDNQMPMFLRLPLIMLATLVPGLFWLFGQALFDDELRWHWRHALPLLLLAAIPLHWLSGPHTASYGQSLSLILHLLGVLLVSHILWLTWRDRRSDLLPKRRTLRLWLGPGIGLYILTVLLFEAGYPDGAVPAWVNLLNLFNLLGICLATLFLSLHLNALLELLAHDAGARPLEPVVASSSVGNTGSNTADNDQPTLQRLQQAMQEEQLWRRESLGVADLANHLGLAEYRLRRLINGALGQRNFNSYLNQFRIQAACMQLADPDKRRLPILSIALDVGFASIGPFNRAFKVQLGLTPSEFRRNKLGEN